MAKAKGRMSGGTVLVLAFIVLVIIGWSTTGFATGGNNNS